MLPWLWIFGTQLGLHALSKKKIIIIRVHFTESSKVAEKKISYKCTKVTTKCTK